VQEHPQGDRSAVQEPLQNRAISPWIPSLGGIEGLRVVPGVQERLRGRPSCGVTARPVREWGGDFAELT